MDAKKIHPDFCRVHECSSNNISFFDPCNCRHYFQCSSNGTENRKCNLTTAFVYNNNIVTSVKCVTLMPLQIMSCNAQNPWSVCNIDRPFNITKCRKIWPEDMDDWKPREIESFLRKLQRKNQSEDKAPILSPSIMIPLLVGIVLFLLFILSVTLLMLIKKKRKNRSKPSNDGAAESPDKGVMMVEPSVQYEEIKDLCPRRKCSIDMLKRPLPDFPTEHDSKEVRYQRILSLYKLPGKKNDVNIERDSVAKNINSVYIPEEGQYNVLQTENGTEPRNSQDSSNV